MKNVLAGSIAAVLIAGVGTVASAQGRGPAGPQMRGDGPAPASKPFSITRSDPGLDAIISANATIETLATGFGINEGVIWIRANLPAGISLGKSAEIATQIRRLVRQSSEVREIASQTGRNDDGTDPYGPNRNELFVALLPYDEWPSGKISRSGGLWCKLAGTGRLGRL